MSTPGGLGDCGRTGVRAVLLWAWLWLAACATPAVLAPLPRDSQLRALPGVEHPVESAGLAHLLRGLYFLHLGRASAAIPHLRLALVYAPRDPFIHERLSRAWAAAGDDTHAAGVLASGLAAAPDDPWLNLLAGERSMVLRQFDAAIPALRVAAQASATQLPAIPLLVEALLWCGDGSAVETASAAVASHPADAELALSLAAVFEDQGRLVEALDLMRTARRQRPAHRTAAFGEARLLELLGQPKQAADALVPLFSYYPDEPELYVAVARLMFRAGAPEAEAFRQEALAQAGEEPGPQTVVAAGDLLEGRTGPGVALLRRTLELHPEAIETRLYLAETLLHLGDSTGCLVTLDEGPALPDPRRAALRASCHATSGELALALEDAVWAVLTASSRIDTLLEVTRWLAATTSQSDAVAALDALIARTLPEGEDAGAPLVRASLFDWLGEADKAVEGLSAIGDVIGWGPAATSRLADLLVRSGRTAEGLELLRAELDRLPDNPIALNAWGFTAADAGVQLAEAEVMVRRAHRLASQEGFIIDSLGWVLFKRGQPAAAIPLLERAHRELPGDPEVLAHLAEAYRAVGRSDAARAAFTAALQNWPTPLLKRQLLLSVQALEPSQ